MGTPRKPASTRQITNPVVPVLSLAETWPHVKPRVVKIGKGLKNHGQLGVTTGCGKVWDTVLHEATESAGLIDCDRCVMAIDKRNTWNRKISYGANVGSEQDAFACGAGLEVTTWRDAHNNREALSEQGRKALGLA